MALNDAVLNSSKNILEFYDLDKNVGFDLFHGNAPYTTLPPVCGTVNANFGAQRFVWMQKSKKDEVHRNACGYWEGSEAKDSVRTSSDLQDKKDYARVR